MSESANQFIKRRSGAFRKNLNKYKNNPMDCYLKWLPDINRIGQYGFIREAWTFMPQFNVKDKLFIIERFKNPIFLMQI